MIMNSPSKNQQEEAYVAPQVVIYDVEQSAVVCESLEYTPGQW